MILVSVPLNDDDEDDDILRILCINVIILFHFIEI